MEETAAQIDGTAEQEREIALLAERDGEFQRPPRRPLVPFWVPYATFGVVALIVVAIALVAAFSAGGLTAVPDVLGKSEGEAVTLLSQNGLEAEVVERRFDTSPIGTVISQNPGAGTQIDRGGVITLVVSAGSEQFTMPDVVGESLAVAKARLETLGLQVNVEFEESEVAKDTVLRTWPGPGETVRSSDVVRLTVASEGSTSPALMPYRIEGLTLVIDPSPVAEDRSDVPLQIARRLQSLLEYSGVEVFVTRSAATSDTADAARAQRALEASAATVALGIDVDESGPSGMEVTTVTTKANSDSAQATTALGETISKLLTEAGRTVAVDSADKDPVLGELKAATVRVRLGSFTSEDGSGLLSDPAASDRIAEILYRAIGERYGTPQ